MELATSLPLFTALLVAVGLGRLAELRISQRRRNDLAASGVAPVAESPLHFRAMVVVHTGVIVGAGVETWIARRELVPSLALTMLTLVVAANALRLWAIATLGRHWNVRIMASLPLGVVSDGPFRFIRHPNYVAVFVELFALPLIHGAWVTAAAGTAAHAWVLFHRIRAEEAMLLRDPRYRAEMGYKPRFFPAAGS